MKTILALILLLTVQCHAVDLTFGWDAPPENFQVESYNIYEVVFGEDPVKLGNTKTPEFTIKGVVVGEHFYYVTLVNLWGESVAYAEGKTPPVYPGDIPPGKLKFKVINLRASVDMDKWYTVASIPVEEKAGPFTASPLVIEILLYETKP